MSSLPPFPMTNGPLFAISRRLASYLDEDLREPSVERGSWEWLRRLEQGTPLGRRYFSWLHSASAAGTLDNASRPRSTRRVDLQGATEPSIPVVPRKPKELLNRAWWAAGWIVDRALTAYPALNVVQASASSQSHPLSCAQLAELRQRLRFPCRARWIAPPSAGHARQHSDDVSALPLAGLLQERVWQPLNRAARCQARHLTPLDLRAATQLGAVHPAFARVRLVQPHGMEHLPRQRVWLVAVLRCTCAAGSPGFLAPLVLFSV